MRRRAHSTEYRERQWRRLTALTRADDGRKLSQDERIRGSTAGVQDYREGGARWKARAGGGGGAASRRRHGRPAGSAEGHPTVIRWLNLLRKFSQRQPPSRARMASPCSLSPGSHSHPHCRALPGPPLSRLPLILHRPSSLSSILCPLTSFTSPPPALAAPRHGLHRHRHHPLHHSGCRVL